MKFEKIGYLRGVAMVERKNIEAERGRAQLTKEQLSKLLGITSKTYLAYIRGAAIPSDILVSMAELFGCSTGYLLERDTQQPTG